MGDQSYLGPAAVRRRRGCRALGSAAKWKGRGHDRGRGGCAMCPGGGGGGVAVGVTVGVALSATPRSGHRVAAAAAASTPEAVVAAPGTGISARGADAVEFARPGPRLAVGSSWRPTRGRTTWWCLAPQASPASSWPRRWPGSRWPRGRAPACPGPWRAAPGRSCSECWRVLPGSWVTGRAGVGGGFRGRRVGVVRRERLPCRGAPLGLPGPGRTAGGGGEAGG